MTNRAHFLVSITVPEGLTHAEAQKLIQSAVGEICGLAAVNVRDIQTLERFQ